MKQKTFPYVLRLTLVLFLITAVVAGLLGLVDALTRDRIDAIIVEKKNAAMSRVLPAEAYEDVAVPDGADPVVVAASAAKTGGETVGWVFEIKPSGFGGDIDLMVGVKSDGTVGGISIISHSETSGLGAVAAQSSTNGTKFRNQFVGLTGPLAVNKDGGTIDALTGATVTSRAITNGVNKALDCAKLLTEGGGAQ